MMGADVRGKCLAAVLAASVAMMVGVMAPSGASASAFVEGESLEWCGTGGGGLALSGDGQTAISGECVFVRSGGMWVKQAVLPLPAFKSGDVRLHVVHYVISSDGNTVIARGEFAIPEDPIFVREDETWTQQGSFPASTAPKLSGDGNTVVLGRYESTHTVVQVFARSGETWAQQASLIRTPVQKGKKGEKEAKNFEAQSLSGDGNTLLVADAAANKGKGADFVYVRSGETWTEQATIAPTGVKGKETFGFGKLSADGSTAVIAETAEPKKGAVLFFTRSGETWSQQGPRVAPPKLKTWSFFGQDLAISGDGSAVLVVSGKPERGRPIMVWVYERSAETWTNTEQLMRPAPEGNFAEAGVDLSDDGSTAMTDYGRVSPPHQTLNWTR